MQNASHRPGYSAPLMPVLSRPHTGNHALDLYVASARANNSLFIPRISLNMDAPPTIVFCNGHNRCVSLDSLPERLQGHDDIKRRARCLLRRRITAVDDDEKRCGHMPIEGAWTSRRVSNTASHRVKGCKVEQIASSPYLTALYQTLSMPGC